MPVRYDDQGRPIYSHTLNLNSVRLSPTITSIDWSNPSFSSLFQSVEDDPSPVQELPVTLREIESLTFPAQRNSAYGELVNEQAVFTIEPQRNQGQPHAGEGTYVSIKRLDRYGGLHSTMRFILLPEQVLELARALHRHGAIAVSERPDASTAST